MDKRDIQISKSIAYLLRHGAIKENLPIDQNGYIPLDLLLKHNRLKTHKCTHDDVLRIVSNNDKKRFVIKMIDNVECIAATQGHSIKIDPDSQVLVKIDLPLTHPLIHGTNKKGLSLILQSGYISKMQRNHIHLSPGVVGQDDNVISGMRKNSPILIYLDTTKLIERGTLFKSLNDVFLTADDIPLSLFEKIIIRGDKKNGKDEQMNKIIELLEKNKIDYEFQTL